MLRYQVIGIALATTISVFLGCFLHFARFQRLYGWSSDFFSLRQIISLLFCTAILFLVHTLMPAFSSPWLHLILSGGTAFLAYAVAAVFLFRKELIRCRQALRG